MEYTIVWDHVDKRFSLCSAYFQSWADHVLALKNAMKWCFQRVQRVHRGRVPNIPDDICDIIRTLFEGCKFRNIMPHSHAFEYEYLIKARLIFGGEDMVDKRKKKRKIRNLGITNSRFPYTSPMCNLSSNSRVHVNKLVPITSNFKGAGTAS